VLARVLADGDVLVVDSGNDRVIVLDPKTDAIVWQYGHTGIAGTRPGYLDEPLSATLVPLGGA
jgi:DNA-binding beta-propeller fold protein YncE